ncbi:DUF2075 domain-containing protein [Lactobacillus amylovorus]|uniref:DUF2075 domain-containing protein n=1 Tax=Lactobacillus amylovorus TaxID=1604 RepID=UPI0023300CC6|nr:DUF2075 domain-containing protein [Lactobacillus amylovorus]MDB6230434.1 DUF2075 domain-containing protein [Lactobacillus amylovorus]
MNNQAFQKLSPNHPLTNEQNSLINRIIKFAAAHLQNKNIPAVFTIYGNAGTGKSVILSSLFDRIQKLSRNNTAPFSGTQNYFLVNHPELLKVYKQIAGPLQELYKKDYMRPTSFINQLDKKQKTADIVVIDEAHLLLSQPDHYNNFYHNNQLEEIIKLAKVVVLVFDEYQVLRMKSFWTKERLEQITHRYAHEEYVLHHQFRMTAPDNLINWFDAFTQETLRPLDKTMWQNYDFRIFTDAEKMRQEIIKRNNEEGLARVLSTSGYPSTLDGGKHYIKEGNFKMPWDQYNYTSTPWAKIPETINEVGSIYTCQGFDLNYAGIIIGPPISQVPHTNKLQVNLDKITDTEMFKKRNDLTDSRAKLKYEEKMVLNSLNVLFKRGIKGTYLYAHDPYLRQTLNSLFIQANCM